MAIGNKQIGWSQEENLLWEISRQLDNMTSIMCTGPCPATTTSTTTAALTTTTTTTAPILNRFEYNTGFAPSLAGFEEIIGFSLTDGVKTGDVITFSNSGYSVPAFAFNTNSNLISVDTLATIVNVQGFRLCTNLVYFSAPILAAVLNGAFAFNSSILSYNIPNLITIGAGCFIGNSLVTSFSFPLATTLASVIFDDCINVTSFDLSSVTDLGGSVGDNNVFRDIIGNNITITIPTAIMTANAGSPDGDIIELQTNNTVTIITV